MPQVNIATTTAPADFPFGTELGPMRFRLEGPTIAQRYTVTSDVPLPAVVTFPNVAPGTYTLSIQRLTSAGLLAGPAYSTTVVVSAPAPVVGDAPVGAEVTVS